MTDKLRWLYCSACGAPEKGSSDCNCQYFVISREEFLGYTKALASSSVAEQEMADALEKFERVTRLADTLASDVPITSAARQHITNAYAALAEMRAAPQDRGASQEDDLTRQALEQGSAE